MVKFLNFSLFLLFCVNISAQSGFEFDRQWSTYYGPVGAMANSKLLKDSNDNIVLSGIIMPDYNTYSHSYYEQFRVGNQYSFPVNGAFRYNSVFSSSGNMNYYDLNAISCVDASNIRYFSHIDNQDNKYYFYTINSFSTPAQPLSNAWYPTNPAPAGQYPMMLVKYAPNGSILYSTYLPGGSIIKADEAGNMYIIGSTMNQNNLTTSGVFQENFLTTYDSGGYLQANGFIAKLSPNGQLLWATYLPVNAFVDAKYYDNNLYLIFGNAFQNTQPAAVSSGAFQSANSHYGLMKVSCNNGQRLWGTYYGPTGNTAPGQIASLSVNQNGLFVSGTDYVSNNYNSNNYFGTIGSYKPQITGSADIYFSYKI